MASSQATEKKIQQKKTGDGVMFYQKMEKCLKKKKIKRRNRLNYLLKKQKLGTITENKIIEVNKIKSEDT